MCCRCEKSFFADKEEYNATPILACPLPWCGHLWCKNCQQSVVHDSWHSCDGSTELDQLMIEKGWKPCPGKFLILFKVFCHLYVLQAASHLLRKLKVATI